ncbi:flagellar biosynthetic protein FliO [Sporosarcina limicola]|uniref:Flagellar protein FliO/FliZ n=1 Tax=Sporosarcina limicola TaxID=34101 RepID=A0A927MLK8_9BACL|nr:flagellar biosynthetic protein FliO [Sporosarcina limicola]MBE1553451.1 flagellar protein FliO/FliZ [Sporosarcina limicola]
MKSSLLKKCALIVILFVLFYSQLPDFTVNADTDPDKSVSDLFENEKKDKKIDKELPVIDRSNDEVPTVGLSVWDYIKTIFALLFVLGLLFGLLKLINRKNRIYNKNKLMSNMGGISLGQHKSIQLVEIGESYYLIGVGEDIRLLKEITNPEEIKRLIEYYKDDDKGLPTGLFDRFLVKLSGRNKEKQKQPADDSIDFSNLFNSKLDEMKEEREQHLGRLLEKERDRDE